ncbi:MAG TPA: glycoside hydrolase family 38 C-terminal domain-containing protein [Propionibacteriaceae bacterium]|nr:glycoside hydrolase family 38 C-terminal domain-containing protein [Propionibacteriaceae bacterium]
MLEVLASLVNVVQKRPVDNRRLSRIRARVYTTVARLDAGIVTSPEPVPLPELDLTAFRPIRPGTAWGRKYDCAWLHVTGQVPPGIADPVVLLGIRGEGLIHSPDGEVLDSVSTVWIQGDLPHSGGVYRPVTHLDLTSGRVDFYADVAYNGWLLYEQGRAVYHGAKVATRDDDAFGLYYDYLTLAVLSASTHDRALAADLDRSLAAAYARFAAHDTVGARAILAEPLSRPSQTRFTYSAIGHGHLDMAWLWPLRETRRKAARTYVRALNGIEARPGYVYGTSQPQQLWWMKQHQPGLYARIKDAVAAGRIELQGSFWVEPDTNLPSGESLVRQALVGRRFLVEEFGVSDEQLRLCWLPDTFGYNGNLPQILRKAGMDWFQTIKLSWNSVNAFPYRTFRWTGIDGSSVLVHMPPEGDYNSRAAADGLLKGIERYPERDLGTALLVYGAGDGGGGPGEIHHELLARERDLYGLPRVEPSFARTFFEALEQREIVHEHTGELYLEAHQGTYTTQAAMKKGNRLMERLLHEAEALAVVVGADSREVLAPHWRDVLLHQFHDIVPGSSIERVHREARETYDRIEKEVGSVIEGLTGRLPAGEEGLSALNLTSFRRAEHVRHKGRWYCAEVPPYGSGLLREADAADHLTCEDDTLGNGILTLRFAESGEITSCTDASGTEQSRGGLNRLVLHDDPYQFPYDAWDIGPDYVHKPPTGLVAETSRPFRDGPTVGRASTYRLPHGILTQRVVLEAGSPVVRFETHVDWHETHRMLRAEFRPARYGDLARCEIQFGHVLRPTTERDAVERAQFEVCAHRWIATEDRYGGFALLNDGKYGHRAKNGLISLNLLRSPTFPDRTADRGSHRFTYAFMPFSLDDLVAVVREGYRLNNPLTILEGRRLDSVVSSSDEGVVVDTVKPAEDGRGMVLRLYEALGRPTTTSIRTTLAHTGVHETDLVERRTGDLDLDAVPFGPFEVKTIMLER